MGRNVIEHRVKAVHGKRATFVTADFSLSVPVSPEKTTKTIRVELPLAMLGEVKTQGDRSEMGRSETIRTLLREALEQRYLAAARDSS